ncbi:MAG TPA: hypothetical protein VF189_05005 [Patescibacteria group bacterium]
MESKTRQRPTPEYRYRYRVRGEEGYRVRFREDDTEYGSRVDRRSTEEMKSTTKIASNGVVLGSGDKDAFDTGGFGGFGGFGGGIIGDHVGAENEGDALKVAEKEERLQGSAYTLISEILKEASRHNSNENTVYLPLDNEDITYTFPAQYDPDNNKLRTLYPKLFLRSDSGEKIAIRIGYLSGPYRDGVKVKREVFLDFTDDTLQNGLNMPPFGFNIDRKLDEVDNLPETKGEKDVEFVQKSRRSSEVTERVYRSPEGLRAFLESKGLTGKATLAPLLYTLLKSGLSVSDNSIRQAEKIGGISIGVVRSNVLFLPYEGRIFSVITDKTTLLSELDVKKIQTFLRNAQKMNLFDEEGRAVEFSVKDISDDRFYVALGDKNIGINWKG